MNDPGGRHPFVIICCCGAVPSAGSVGGGGAGSQCSGSARGGSDLENEDSD